MSEFTFNLAGIPINPTSMANDAGKFESSIYSNTKDSDLTYTGNDSIVWDRINKERLRRGLSSLSDIGYPRPNDDAVPTGSTIQSGAATGETFVIKGPPGMTLEQAQAIFKQQVDTGSLTGFKVGDTLSAATQAADGLAAAAPQLGQGLAAAAGLLPAGINSKSISDALGPGGAAVSNQISAAMTGAGPAIASMSSGVTSAINSATSAASRAIPSGFNTLFSQAPGGFAQLNSVLPGAVATLGQGAQAINGILSKAIGGSPTQGINIADMAKQLPSLGGIGNLNSGDVTATLAQASKLIGQGSAQLSNALGVGKFGFDASQLERAGMIKPGTAAEFLNQAQNDLTDVLKSPTVWTGKDGVKGLSDLLGKDGLQNKIQQGLMSSGLTDLKQIGIPTDKLTPQALSGLATNAAKSVEDAAKWAKGAALPADVKAGFDKMAANGAFAVNLAQGKAEEPVLKERVVEPSTNTVNSATVDAAGDRIVGNAKVPNSSGSGSSGSAEIAVTSYVELLNETNAALDSLTQNSLTYLSQQQQISQSQWNTANQEYQAIRASFNARNNDLIDNATSSINSLSTADPNYARLVNIYNNFGKLFNLVKTQSETVKKIISDLANKIAT